MKFLASIVFCLLAASVGAQQPVTNDARVRFLAVDIFVDSKDKPLAAYQLEFSTTNGNVKIVGIEGGEHPAFRDPPFYDPKAMQQERVIIAAFSTESPNKLPNGKTRVATIHLKFSGNLKPHFSLAPQAAANDAGNAIQVDANLVERTLP